MLKAEDTLPLQQGTFLPESGFQGHHPFSRMQIIDIESKVTELSSEDLQAFNDMENVFSDDISTGLGD